MKDDDQYVDLMSRYKVTRRNPDKEEEANLLLLAAMTLRQEGEVSQDAIIGAAYL